MPDAIAPRDLPRYVPGEVLSASDSLGWKDVMQRSYRYAGLDVAVPALDHFTLVRYCHGTPRMQRRFEGAWSHAACGPGDISLMTRAQASQWHWDADIEVSHVYLAPALMARVARDVTGRCVSEVRLHDILCLRDPVLTGIVDSVAREARSGAAGNALYVEALGTQLAVHLLRHHASVSFAEAASRSRLAPQLERRLREYIDTHLHEPISLECLAEVAGLGVWTFSRRFRESFGSAPHAYVVGQRVERARRLLAEGRLAVKEVSAACGFADQAHLTRTLHARLGITPAVLRRRGGNRSLHGP